jgi:ubiquinone/menaquinone biosynthesis C-methylase UbiE/uncharacterized protein YbaR (Trm112 family)
MKQAFLELICCPACQSALELQGEQELDNEIWQGKLRCQKCNMVYPLENGMPLLYVDDEKWMPKAREAAGWVTHLKNLNLYDPERDGIDYVAPDFPAEPWLRIKNSFDTALEELKLTGKETILDLGAGNGWAAKNLALTGCTVVALDITTDKNVGLGRAKVLMNKAGTYFDRIIGDGENLPFHPNTFDVVFCCGSIHHSSDIPLLMANIGRILKPNGRLCAINEPCIDVLANEQHVLAAGTAEELALGINENRPNLIGYATSLWQNGFEILTAFPSQSTDKSPERITMWAYNLNATWRGWPYKGLRSFIGESLRFGKREVKAFILNGLPYIKVRLNSPKEETARKLWAVLLWCNTELILLARKTEA